MKPKIIAATIVGNALEYYDFTIFAVFSLTIGQLFFPSYDALAQTLLSLLVFAIGFLMRPLGSILFGHIGDKYGRKKALTLSIACMAIPTFLIGLLPGYETLGIYAPLLLVLLRLIQGTSIGGEGAGSAIFVLEHRQQKTQGLLASIVTASNILGAFVATLVGLIAATFNLEPEAWRVAFMLGGCLGLFGVYLRLYAPETPAFEAVVQKNQRLSLPFLKVLASNKKQILLCAALGGVSGAVAYVVLAYINIYCRKTLGLDPNTALLYATLGIGSFIVFLPLFGYCADRFGASLCLRIACSSIICLSIPAFMLMAHPHWAVLMAPVITLGALGALICAPAYPFMLKLFPTKQRYSGMAFSFNLGIALFGGTAPMVATFLSQKTSMMYAPSFYLVALASFYLLCHALVYKKIHVVED